MSGLMDTEGLVVVAGAGGFIGDHFVMSLLERGFEKVRAVDLKQIGKWY
jgi:nucleoside-diphosphate-sugar epimerase